MNSPQTFGRFWPGRNVTESFRALASLRGGLADEAIPRLLRFARNDWLVVQAPTICLAQVTTDRTRGDARS